MTANAYFQSLGDNRYRPSDHAGGAWSPGEIHFGPLGGLIAHVIERHIVDRVDAPLQLSRISFDILGFLSAEEIAIRVEIIRPGRSIELVEATVEIAGRRAVLARAWFLGAFDTLEVAGGEPAPPASPETAEPLPMDSVWKGGFVPSLDARILGSSQPGRAAVWLASDTELVAGEAASPLASWIALIDTANGIAVRQHPTEWMFPNVDLTIHLYRHPIGRWVGLDTSVVFGGGGLGLTNSVLHDREGGVGTAQQALTVRRLRV